MPALYFVLYWQGSGGTTPTPTPTDTFLALRYTDDGTLALDLRIG
jgi:hypothetical protein